MRIVGFFFLCLSFPLMAANQITTQIHDVDFGHHQGDEILVFLKSGHVAKISEWNLKMIEEFQMAKSNDNWFRITLDEKRNIIDVEDVEAPYSTNVEKTLLDNPVPYVPTTVASMEKAKEYIREGRRPITSRVTQCFNRAMIWSYEWWRNHSLKSMKVFVFWTKDYVRKFGHEWWFHVAPYVHVMDEDGQVKERVMDVKWLSRPYKFQEWADYHSPKDIPCKVVKKYSDYANHPWGTDRCYFMRTHMYTWQPMDLELYESWDNYSKNAFNMDEVRSAYLEAFEIRL